jgi:hypothetical protein
MPVGKLKMKKIFEDFASDYRKDEVEILVLTSDAPSGAGKVRGERLWRASKYFLAYVDMSTGELKNGEGRIVWPLTDEEMEKRTSYHFKNGCVYRLKARELIDKTVPDGMLPSFFNRFLVVGVLEEDVPNNELLAVLERYREPVKITDETLGDFDLNKDLALFNGYVNWLGGNISVSLDVNADDKETWTKAMKALRLLFERQERKDLEFRAFAADSLTCLANDWRQDEDEEGAEISKEDFMGRISLSSLVVTSDGNFTAYYNDDDMFLSHVITVSGSVERGPASAFIEG